MFGLNRRHGSHSCEYILLRTFVELNKNHIFIVFQTLIDDVYYNGLGHTHLAPNITELQGVGIEFFLGLVLVLTVFGACDAHKPGDVDLDFLFL